MKKDAGTIDYFTDDVVMPSATGKGIKFGEWDESGNESPRFGWKDITGPIEVRGVGATDPDWAQIGSGPFYGYKFAVNDKVWICFHIPHDIVPGADIHLHAHWISSGTNVQPVKWEWTYTFAKGFNQSAYDTTGTVITAQEAASGTAWQHMVTETAAITIASLTEPDGLLYVQLRRITNGGTENTDNIFMLTTDVHYQTTNLATLNKAPGFYG